MANVIVIGGGAAGMMAAYTAAGAGAGVLLLEKNEKLGKKIYITGKGRCNFTNACDTELFFKNVVRNPRFMYSSLHSFTPADMMELLEKAGCRVKIERGNRAFPASDHASDVTKALAVLMRKAKVDVRLNTEVRKVSFNKSTGQYEIKAHETKSGKSILLHAGRLIICTGGLSYPSTGSTGDGYRFADSLGIGVAGTSPSLVPLTCAEAEVSFLQGVSLKNVGLTVTGMPDADTAKATGKGSKNKAVYSGQGEMLFTHFGLSGPLVLSASALISAELQAKKRFIFEIDLKPALSIEQLDARILRDFSRSPNQAVKNAMVDLLIGSLIAPVLERAGIDENKRVRDITREERTRLSNAIKAFRWTVIGTRGYNEAIITRGGVETKELDPKTMESRKYPGLYFAGEVLDVDAFTGGFNLQIAWSTGHAAGLAAASA